MTFTIYKKACFIFALGLLMFGLTSCQKNQSTDKVINEINSESSATTKKINLPFKYKVVSGKNALETCLKLRKEYKGKLTPVIISTYADAKNLSESFKYNTDSAKDIIKKSLNYNIQTLIQSRLKEDHSFYSSVDVGEWPNELTTIDGITSDKDIMSEKFLKEVYIVLVPTGNSWEVPAYLKFGGWNECPSPEEQVGTLRYWYNKYGAQVVALKSDVLECTVDNPPKTKEQAMNLAKEQYFYCSDIVDQGTGDISTLAGSLYKAKYWYFWWD